MSQQQAFDRRTSDVAVSDVLLSVDDLTVSVEAPGGGRRRLVDSVSFEVRRGEVLALVGESGSGKSTVCLAITRLLGSGVSIERGSIRLEQTDLVKLSPKAIRRVRGKRIGMVFQDPLASLNPVRTIGFQLREPRRIHRQGDRKSLRLWVRQTLASLGFSQPEHAAGSYPSTFSGGMRQRTCIGIAFAASPDLVIADEPTTALDISLQGRLLRLLLDHRENVGTAIILVSHDIDVVGAVADRVVVLYGGRKLESGPTDAVLRSPASPYTRALLAAVPHMDPSRRGHPLPTIEGGGTVEPSEGCPFAPRCPRALERCREEFPTSTDLDRGTKSGAGTLALNATNQVRRSMPSRARDGSTDDFARRGHPHR
jgi:oligopeptide/dipeptide ABC transporter ATP-binding protein